MALMKGDIGGGGNKRPVIGRSLLQTPTSKLFHRGPFDETVLQAGRNAQRSAQSRYIAATVHGVEQANLGDMGQADEMAKETAARRAASRKAAATKQSSSGNDALKSLADMFSGGMTQDEIRAQAASMFKPQFDYLTGLENSAKGRAKVSDKMVSQLYAALQRGYKQDAAPVGNLYDQAAGGVSSAYKEGAKAIGTAQDQTAARTAAVMKKLGIEQAGPEMFKENVADAQAAQQRLLSQNAVEQAGFKSTKNAALQDLVVKGQAAGLVGADQRSQLQGQLAEILAGYGMKRADLSTEQAKAAMDIQNNQASQQQDQMKFLMQQEQQNFENDRALRNDEMASDKFDYQRQYDAQNLARLQQANQPKLSPWEQANYDAQKAYGNPQSAGNAMRAVEDTMSYWGSLNPNKTPTMQDLVEYMRQRNPNSRDIGQLNHILELLYPSRYH
jgi:hypothetical protein